MKKLLPIVFMLIATVSYGQTDKPEFSFIISKCGQGRSFGPGVSIMEWFAYDSVKKTFGGSRQSQLEIFDTIGCIRALMHNNDSLQNRISKLMILYVAVIDTEFDAHKGGEYMKKALYAIRELNAFLNNRPFHKRKSTLIR